MQFPCTNIDIERSPSVMEDLARGEVKVGIERRMAQLDDDF